MKLLLFILLSCNYLLIAQTMDWRIAQQIGDNTGNEEVRDMAIDSEGNVYIVGSFYATITWGNQSMTSQGYNDGFLIKINCSGQLEWMQQLSGSGYDEIRCVTVDKDDNIIIGGFFGLNGSQSNIGGFTITSAGNRDIFIAKSDGQGNFLWVNDYGGSSSDSPAGITTDSVGDIYVTGSFSTSLSFGGQSWLSNGAMDLFICKLSSSGNDLWFYPSGGTGYDYGNAIKVKDSKVYVCGDFENTVNFGTGPLNSNGDYDIFLMCMDTTSTVINWVNTYGSNVLDGGYDIEVNSQGDILMCGELDGAISFGNGVNISPQGGAANSYIIKLDQSGSTVWGHGLISNDDVYAYECELDNDDNIYVTGAMFAQTNVNNLTMDVSGGTTFWYNNTFLFMLDDSGNGIWELNVPGDGMNNHGFGMVVNGSNEVYLGGRVEGVNTFGSLPSISGDLNNTQSAYVALYGRPDLKYIHNIQTDSLEGCDRVTLLANDGALNYVWYADNIEVQVGLVDSLISPSLSTYIVEDQACPEDRDTFVLYGTMNGQISTNSPMSFCVGDDIQIQAGGANIYNWAPSSYLSCDDCADPIVSPLANIVYELTMEKDLCRDTLSIEFIEDNNCVQPNFFIPNAFSPNGDGVNDLFRVRYVGNYQGVLEVYDRWGKLIYQNDMSHGWDGKYKSNDCPKDVYIFNLLYTNNEQTVNYTGNVTLTR